jgi:hypothetical protein
VSVAPFRYVTGDEDSGRWVGFSFRDGDIVISTRSKRHNLDTDDLRAADLSDAWAACPAGTVVAVARSSDRAA